MQIRFAQLHVNIENGWVIEDFSAGQGFSGSAGFVDSRVVIAPARCAGVGAWPFFQGPSRPIVAGIERQLGGIVKFDWQASGLRCTLSVPHDPNKESLRRIPIDLSQTKGRPAQDVDPNDKRVLLVEDEPLVSMMLADMLAAFGHKVDGPYNRFSDAMLAAKSNNLQAGILDVNLGGEKTYAVADILANRKIPFAFVTGYGPDTIVSEFSHAPVLQKPIEAAKLHALLQQIVR